MSFGSSGSSCPMVLRSILVSFCCRSSVQMLLCFPGLKRHKFQHISHILLFLLQCGSITAAGWTLVHNRYLCSIREAFPLVRCKWNQTSNYTDCIYAGSRLNNMNVQVACENNKPKEMSFKCFRNLFLLFVHLCP
uniref:Uncharacterized protein n=1 Tax=Oryzias latipes TaxID=8090 RepID=A0A3B3I941_ORYLA